MATTISRPAMTDDSGTPASPTGDGTTLNKSFFDTILDNIDAMWSGATQVFDGIFLAQGFGLHQINASGTGGQRLNIRNQAAGTGNFSQLALTNDLNRGVNLECFASTWTTAANRVQDGANVAAAGPGGLSLAATEATADVRIYARGTAKLLTFNGDTVVLSAGVVGSYSLSGVLHDSVDLGSDGTPANTSETTLKSFTLPAGALAVDNQGIRIIAWGDTAANANNKTIRAKFGATTVQTNTFTGAGTGGGGWYITADIFRTGAATQKAIGRQSQTVASNFGDTGNDVMQFTSPAETLSGTVAIVITGQNGTASANDITCEGFYVEFLGGA